MSLRAKSDGTPPEQAPVGTHVAVCVHLIDRGTQTSEFYKNSKPQILLGFELVNEKNAKGENFIIWRKFTNSMFETAGLRLMIERWRGKSFANQEEADAFDTRKLVGQPCLVNAVASKDGKWTNIGGIMALPKGQPKPIATRKRVIFDIDEWDDAVFATFSDKHKATIMASPEAKARFAGQGQQRTTQEMPEYIPEQEENPEAGFDLNDPPF